MNLKNAVVSELHKPVRRNFPRRQTVIKGMNDLYQADLVDMTMHSKENKGFKYILTLIDCFTKVAHAFPLKDKSGRSVVKSFNNLIKNKEIKLKNLQTDDGREFFNSEFSSVMKRYDINHYSTFSDKKASIVERFNRTFKNLMYKTFSKQGSHNWIDVLPDLLLKYNNSFHRTIGMKPIKVNKTNEKTVLSRINQNTTPNFDKKPPKVFKVGEKVRISKYKGIFTKGYLPNWTNEVFEVFRVQPTNPETYILKDNKGEILKGGFYGHELLKSSTGDVYLVEKILKEKNNEVLVRWLGFNKTQDSWISKRNLL